MTIYDFHFHSVVSYDEVDGLYVLKQKSHLEEQSLKSNRKHLLSLTLISPDRSSRCGHVYDRRNRSGFSSDGLRSDYGSASLLVFPSVSGPME